MAVDRVRRPRLDNVDEFDGYVETEDKVFLIETKTTLRSRDVRDFVERVERYKVRAPRGKTVIPMAIYSIEGENLEKLLAMAKAHGIVLVKHHGEYEFEVVNQ